MSPMLRLLTAGESHGKGLATIVEGLPAGVPVSTKAIAHELERRRHGYGRSGRQKLEGDRFEILSGVRHGCTLGSPVAITIANAEWETKFNRLMAVEGEPDPADRLTRPRPGHADLVGTQKYGFDDVRNVLERASARETVARVAGGALCKAFLSELGIEVVSHVVRIGHVAVPASMRLPRPEDLDAIDASPVRCLDEAVGARMVAEIDLAQHERDTLGGVFEVLAYGCPPGLGSHVHFDRKLDGRLALALMSIQSVKGVEVGDGMATGGKRGSRAHDEIVRARDGRLSRRTGRSGGIEGGMSTGEPIRVRAAMKPISTIPTPLSTVDLATGAPDVAIKQRTDVCAVPAGGVVGEAAVALVLADAALEKFGGDSIAETRRNLDAYLETLR
jgi:chorismate synthase